MTNEEEGFDIEDIVFADWEEAIFDELGLLNHVNRMPKIIGQLHMDLALFPIFLGRKVLEEDKDLCTTLLNEELVDKFAMFNSRTQLFFRRSNFWYEKVSEENDHPDYKSPNALHILAPLYVQQLEGPLRYKLAAFIDLMKSVVDGQGDWKDCLYISTTKKKNFKSLLGETFDQLERVKGCIKRGKSKLGLKLLEHDPSFIEKLLPEGELSNYTVIPDVNNVRNSFAHADYEISYSSDDKNKFDVTLKVNGKEITRPLLKFIEFIQDQNLLMHYLSVGLTVAVAKIALEHGRYDYYMVLHESYTKTYPLRPDSSFTSRLRDAMG